MALPRRERFPTYSPNGQRRRGTTAGDDYVERHGESLSIAGGVLLAALIVSTALADGDISAQRLLASWHDDDPGMRMIAEVIASAFASGFSWGGDAAGKRTYCASQDLKGAQIMSAFEAFIRDNPSLAERPYGEAMAGTLRKAFPCGQGT